MWLRVLTGKLLILFVCCFFCVSSEDVSVIVITQSDQITLISGALFSLDYAFRHQALRNDAFSAEVLIVKIGDSWGDEESDVLYQTLKQTPVLGSSLITNLELLENDSIESVDNVDPNSMALKINAAATKAKGEILVFLTHNTQVEPEFLDPILNHIGSPITNIDIAKECYQKISEEVLLFQSQEEQILSNFKVSECTEQYFGVGLVGGKQITSDGKLADGGIDFRFHHISKGFITKETFEIKVKGENEWRNSFFAAQHQQVLDDSFNHLEISTEEAMLPIIPWKGESKDYKLAQERRELSALSGTFVAIRKELFVLFGGLDMAYTQKKFHKQICFSFVDFALYLREAGWNVIYEPESIAVLHLESKEEEVKEDTRLFASRWNSQLSNSLSRDYVVTDMHVIYRMECGTTGVLGFTVEAVNILQGLEVLLPLSAGSSDSKRCIRQLEESKLEEHKLEMLKRLFDRTPQLNRPVLLIIHKDPGRYQAELTRANVDPFYVIGRSMYETDRIPEKWIPAIEKYVDEIWVPSQFNIESFVRGGIEQSKLQFIGESLDVHSLDPNLSPTRFHFKGDCYSNCDNENNENIFTFLNVMKFENRKGWKELIQAFIAEFRSTEPVRLVFRSSILHYEERQLRELITELEDKHGPGASIQFIKTLIPFGKVRELYRAADAVVSASHGEGWGLPLMEAMSMGLPTLAVNWSGNTEFMNHHNSFLVDAEGLTDKGTPYSGHKWSMPSISHLRSQLRAIYVNEENISRSRSVRARKDIIEHWNIPVVANRMAQMIKQISEEKEIYKKRKELRSIVHLGSSPPSISPTSFTKDDKTFYNMKMI